MKGIILAGGLGTRLGKLTAVTNKHCLPVYNKPMIFFPIQTLVDAGIKDIFIISGPEHSGHFLRLLGSGKDFGAKFTFGIQDTPGGIAHALSLAQDFADKESVAVILGDNIFEDQIAEYVRTFKSGAKVFLKEVHDAQRFGVAQVSDDAIISIEEKPKQPKSNLAVTGLYLYDNTVFDIIKALRPSGRGELEITDVNNAYVKKETMQFAVIKGFWSDAGTYDSLLRASLLVKDKLDREGKQSR